MARFSALLDACVLVPVTQADTLLRLAEAGLFRPLWSACILEEMTTAIEMIHPELDEGATRRAQQMDKAFPDASVHGWEPLEIGITLPDPDDVHVVAAAVRGRADVIVTNNVKDFPSSALAPLGLEAQNADEFLLNQLSLEPQRTMEALTSQARAAKRPPLTVEELMERLTRCGAVRFGEAARRQRWRSPAGWQPDPRTR